MFRGGIVYPYLSRKDIKNQPEKEVEDKNETEYVVDVNSCPEFHQTEKLTIPDLEPGHNQNQKTDGIDPVPYSYRQWMQIYLFHLLSPFLIPFNLFASRMGEVSILKVIWSIGTDMPPKIISTADPVKDLQPCAAKDVELL